MPVEFFLRKGDIRFTLSGIVRREWTENKLRRAASKQNNHLCQFQHGKLSWITYVYRTCHSSRCCHHADHGFNKIINIAEASGLLAVPVNGNIFPLECLNNKVTDNAAVMRMHSWSVGIKYSYNLDIKIVLPMVVEEECFRTTLPLVITTADTDRVDFSPVLFWLRMNFRVAVHFAGRCLKNASVQPFCQAKHIDSTMNTRFGGLDGIMLIMDRRGRACKIVNLIHLNIEREGYIVADYLEVWLAGKMGYIVLASGKKIVETQYLITFS